MSSSPDQEGTGEPSNQQAALPVGVPGRISEAVAGDLLATPTTSALSSGPPKPAIRQKTQKTMQVSGLVSAVEQQQQVRVIEQQDDLIRPQSAGLLSVSSTRSESSAFHYSVTETSSRSLFAARTLDLASSSAGSSSSTTTTANASQQQVSASQFASVIQSAGGLGQQQISTTSTGIKRTSSTIQQRTTLVTQQRTQVSSSTTASSRLSLSSSLTAGTSLGAASGRLVGIGEQNLSSQSGTLAVSASTSTSSRQAFVASSRTVTSSHQTGRFSLSSSGQITSAGIQSIGQRQSVEAQRSFSSSSQFVTAARSSSTSGSYQEVAAEAGDTVVTYRPLSLLDSPASPLTTSQQASSRLAIVDQRQSVTDQSGLFSQSESESRGQKIYESGKIETQAITGRSSVDTGNASTSASSITTQTTRPDIWTTTPQERAIASRYLDKSFKSESSPLTPTRPSGVKTFTSFSAKIVGEEKSENPFSMTSQTTKSTSKEAQVQSKGVANSEQSPADSAQGPNMMAKVEIAPNKIEEPESSHKDVGGDKRSSQDSSIPINSPQKAAVESIGAFASSEFSAANEIQISDKERTQSDDFTDSSENKQIMMKDFSTLDERIINVDTAASGKANSQTSKDDRTRRRSSRSSDSETSLSPAGHHSRVPSGSLRRTSKDQATIPIISATTSNANYSAIASKNSTYLPLPAEMPPQRPYPKKVFFIIVNEFCERFSYYGFRTILVLFLKNALDFSDTDSTVSFHLFAALCYLTPIMGGILADSYWGKFKTILYLSIVYFFGELILVIASVIWKSRDISIVATVLALILIGFGTGGIKPCVSVLGGDQFYAHEVHWRQTFFSIFYGAINIGALLSMFSTPLLRSKFQCVDRTDCFPYAFGLPSILMLVATVVFALGKNRYYLTPLPERNVILAFCQCTWLSVKRKFSGYRPPEAPINLPINPKHQRQSDVDTSSSNLSVSSGEGAPSIKQTKKTNLSEQQLIAKPEMLSVTQKHGGKSINHLESTRSEQQQAVVDRSHWLYLASDRFDTRSIEEFRSVLGALFLMLPWPVYWCLFDQQSSLWTLQATRMDGRVFGFVVEPDQMSVLNPMLLLASIPIFQLLIYPLFARCNLLTSSIQRLTTGGLMLALAFVASALIEFRMQQYLPPTGPEPGNASLLLINGLGDCSLTNPTISYVQIPENESALLAGHILRSQPLVLNYLEPMSAKGLNVLPSSTSTPIQSYKISFQLTNAHLSLVPQSNATNGYVGGSIAPTNGCPFSQNIDQQVNIEPLTKGAVKLVYLEQGNGKLAHRVFEDSLELPKSGKARVRLLYEFFGSATVAFKHQFLLHRQLSASQDADSDPKLKFHTLTRDGQVLVSKFLDIDVKAAGEEMTLKTVDELIGNTAPHKIFLKPGTRNLIIVRQNSASNVEIKHQLLQDNDYRVSILYQIIPYALLSFSEVLFTITTLDFSYSLAPTSMKTLVSAASLLTNTFGNLLTVAIESMNLFPNLVYDYLFYAAILAADMALMAIMGHYYIPRKLADNQ